MAAMIDHLWQSALFVGLILALARLTQSNPATLRLSLWRAAAAKFVIPFAALFAFGAWLGFPVRHSAIAPPPAMVRLVDATLPVVAPAQAFASSGSRRALALGVALGLAAGALWLVRKKLRAANGMLAAERSRIEADRTAEPPPPGFLKTLALAGSLLLLMVAPIVGGALRDRQWRQESLAADTAALRTAGITLTETTWRFGDRTQVVASANQVLIRKINLQDLVALVYGIGEFEVFGGALPWLESPHYDVSVIGPVRDPEAFDPYSLREPVTNYLSREFGVAIRVNGACQEPCLNQESFTVERLPWKILDPGARQ